MFAFSQTKLPLKSGLLIGQGFAPNESEFFGLGQNHFQRG